MASAAPARVSESKPELWGRGSREELLSSVAVGKSLWREGVLEHAAALGGRAGRARARGALEGIYARAPDPAARPARPAGVSAFGSFIKGNLNTIRPREARGRAATCQEK